MYDIYNTPTLRTSKIDHFLKKEPLNHFFCILNKTVVASCRLFIIKNT